MSKIPKATKPMIFQVVKQGVIEKIAVSIEY